MNPLMQGREVQFYLSNTGAKALIGSLGFAQAATEGADSAGAKVWLVDDAELARMTDRLARVRRTGSSAPPPTPPSCFTRRAPPARRRAPS